MTETDPDFANYKLALTGMLSLFDVLQFNAAHLERLLPAMVSTVAYAAELIWAHEEKRFAADPEMTREIQQARNCSCPSCTIYKGIVARTRELMDSYVSPQGDDTNPNPRAQDFETFMSGLMVDKPEPQP